MESVSEALFQVQAGLAVTGLAVFWLLEGLLPFFEEAQRRGRARLRHAARNLALGLVNAAATALALAGATAAVTGWAQNAGWGLLRLLHAPLWLETVVTLLLLDGWMYAWHRASHAAPFLWRFHRVHHSDTVLDVTSAARFHVGEIALSALARLPLLALLGAELWQVVLYEALLLPVIQFHHSNVAVSERWDRRLRLVIVSPNMHRVHHSRVQADTDSNYASLLSVWDRLAGTFRQRPDPRAIRFGLSETAVEAAPGVLDLLVVPFRPPQRVRARSAVHRPHPRF